MKRKRQPRPTEDGLARMTSKRDASAWNRRRCVCGEAFDDHVHQGDRFPCARPYCRCKNFEGL